MQTFRMFATEQEARDYRHEHGTGGWIFAPENGSACVLFPPEMMPTAIFHHRLVKGMTGQLIGCA